ncbi:unnamed protein product [Heligmosomoides polygyrus]|uniref:FMN hydroxy acid dehydrogenase domain-containing protein n=1 Tax=Heligmosomoides polygyrus TaxID=6339 RepID=A0A3P8AYV1_HELPZ|nr:unnamed protein product [Heligmosomoides polygyrus]
MTVDDYRKEASLRLKKLARDYYEAGSEDQLTLARNENAFQRLLIRPRCLRDVSKIDTSVQWFGRNQSFPIGLAPSAFHCLATKDGELSTVRGASKAGSVMIISSWSTTAIEDVAKQAKQDNVELWFQLYVYKNKAITSNLVSRAEANGCKALVLTVDTPVLGRRLVDIRNGFTLPKGLRMANIDSLELSLMPSVEEGKSGLLQYVSDQVDPGLDWDVLDWTTKLPVIVKGVMRGDDADEAVRKGVHGIIVSNHGGRQMDSAPATVGHLDVGLQLLIFLGSSNYFLQIEVLSKVVRAVKGRVPVR